MNIAHTKHIESE